MQTMFIPVTRPHRLKLAHLHIGDELRFGTNPRGTVGKNRDVHLQHRFIKDIEGYAANSGDRPSFPSSCLHIHLLGHPSRGLASRRLSFREVFMGMARRFICVVVAVDFRACRSTIRVPSLAA